MDPVGDVAGCSDEHFAIAVGDEVGNVGLMVNALEGDHEDRAVYGMLDHE